MTCAHSTSSTPHRVLRVLCASGAVLCLAATPAGAVPGVSRSYCEANHAAADAAARAAADQVNRGSGQVIAGVSGLGCLTFSAVVLGLDGGTMAAGCAILTGLVSLGSSMSASEQARTVADSEFRRVRDVRCAHVSQRRGEG